LNFPAAIVRIAHLHGCHNTIVIEPWSRTRFAGESIPIQVQKTLSSPRRGAKPAN
jgi:hypothetical protein